MASETWLNDFVLTVDDFFTQDECERYIQISEDVGYEDALVTVADGSTTGRSQRLDSVRNNQRVMFRSDEIAELLWERIVDFVPVEHEGRYAVGCNEMLRFYRYDPGQQFNWHQDFPYERDNGEISFWTLMIYLNGDFKGGETSFEDSYSDQQFDPLSVVPNEGTALLFQHSTHHKGEPVREGRKYVLRTDVMYASDLDEVEDLDSQQDHRDEDW